MSVDNSADQLWWFANDMAGTFTASQISDYTGSVQDLGNDVATGDITGDNSVEIVVASDKKTRLSLYVNSGDGSTFSQTPIDGGLNDAKSVFVVDVDGDGNNDVVSAATKSGKEKFYWYENSGAPATDDDDDTSWGFTPRTTAAQYPTSVVFVADDE